MDRKHRILLINYDFPPNPGIGGRRWAKFARQLADNGHLIHVIKADPPAGLAPSAWSADIMHDSIHVYSIPRTYPRVLSHPGRSILDRINYRLARRSMESKTSGSIYDQSIGWDAYLVPLATKIIAEEGIDTLIATGAPWNILEYACTIRQHHPHLTYLADFRDPWLSAKNYGMAGLSASRRKVETEKQARVVSIADVVTSPYEHLTNELKKFGQDQGTVKTRFEVLTHFFDHEDLPSVAGIAPKDRVIIVYGGDLYNGLEPQLQHLRKQLDYLRVHRVNLFNKTELRIYTGSQNIGLFKDMSNVRILNPIGKRIFEEFASASFNLILLSHAKRNDRTTKFFECAAIRRPLLVISDEGEVTSSVRENRLGYVLGQHENALCDLVEQYLAGRIATPSGLAEGQFSLRAVTAKLEAFLA